MKFWDSSAIIPLLVEQPVSPRADSWFGEDPELAIWTLTPVEVVSALCRLVREGRLDERVARQAESRARELVEASHVVIDVESVKALAARLLRVHPLRAADALQLAAGLAWAGGTPVDRDFVTFDSRLATAARREGFQVLTEPE